MKKRLFSFVLAALVLLSSVPIGVFAEGDDADTNLENLFKTQFTVDNVTVGNDDETVQVSISTKNGGFAGMNYQLLFDSDALSLEQQPEVNAATGFEFMGGLLEAGKHNGMLLTTENVYGANVLVTYTFKINPDVKAGTYEIKLITADGSVAIPDGGTVELRVYDENLESVPTVITNGGVTVPGYIVSYDANGGEGAPDKVVKSKNDFVYISSVVPQKAGHTFLGWATSSSATEATYKAGDKYSANEDVTLYAVWQKQQLTAGSIDIAVSHAEAKAGEEVEVAISVANNPGIAGMEFDVVFDNTKLSYVGASLVSHDDEEITLDSFGFTKPNPDTVTNKMSIILLANVANLVGDGDVLKIKFKVLDTAEDGFADVSIVPVDFFKYVGENMDEADIIPNVTNGGVEIMSQLLGDVNLDEVVDMNDAILVLQYSMFPDIYPIGYKGSVDFTKDGNVDMNDAILLLQYSMFPDLYPIE